MSNRRDFLSQPAPENYVAGLGRGATGFTTRSDLGPAREGPSDDQIKAAVAKRSAQLGLTDGKRGSNGAKDTPGDDGGGADDGRYQDPDNEVGLFAGGIYEKDDEEADRIWKEVDDKMARRRQKQREARETAEREEHERQNPKIQQQFAGLKRALESVTDEEWANLPDVKDLTGRTKRARQARMQRHYAVPDSVLAASRDAGQFTTTVNDDGTETATPKTPTGGGGGQDGTVTDFAKIGQARDKVLQARLEQASQGTATAGSATSIDPKGYLTSLKSMQGAGQSIGDLEQFRKMLKSAVDSNPKQAASWIAAARLEIVAGKMVAARTVIANGCQHCPKSEDIWLENMHLNDKLSARVIAADAIRHNPHSVKLWVEAMKLETDSRSKKKVIRKALDNNQESEALWKEAVNLEENVEDARLLLAKATELIPESLDLWLALARIEAPKNAKKVLMKAARKLPNSHEVWVAAARLEEQLGEAAKSSVLKNAVKVLAQNSAMPKREEWIAEAEKCEEEGAVITCRNIIMETIGWGLDEDDDRKQYWLDDARASASRDRFATARAIYAEALRKFATSKSVWMAAVDLERHHGAKEDLVAALNKAVEACPHADEFWLMLAREKADNIDEARKVLKRAFDQNPDNENIWLTAVKLEADNGFTAQARGILREARQKAPTDRVWMKSVAFERQQDDPEAALDLAQEALQLFPAAPKLWMQKGQIYEDVGRAPQARDAYSLGVKAAPSSVPLWLLYARLEVREGNLVKARSVLDRARQACPAAPELWAELIRLERQHANNAGQARSLMATALQKFPRSGLLWRERILHLEARTQRKSLLAEAMRKEDADPLLQLTAGCMLWAERRLDRAQAWFERALLCDTDLGDAWAWYYRFLSQHGTPERRAELAAKCALNDPRHGEAWTAISKQPRNAGKTTEEILGMVAATLKE